MLKVQSTIGHEGLVDSYITRKEKRLWKSKYANFNSLAAAQTVPNAMSNKIEPFKKK